MNILFFLNSRILEIPFYLGLIILLGVLSLALLKRLFLKNNAPRIFLYSSGLVAAYLIYVAYLQFVAFQNDFMSLVLGTRGGLQWFLGYVQTHYWNDYLISFPVALIFLWVARYFNRKHNERYFEKEESFLAALGIMLVGYPAFLFYLPLVLIVPAIASAVFVRKGERLPLYHFWIPVALFVLLVVQFWASNQQWWLSFRF